MNHKSKQLFFVLVFLLLCCGGCRSRTAATSIRLSKIEGQVAVADGDGKDIPLTEGLGLYSGYEVGTKTASYAWMDLDTSRLTKLDSDSQARIEKEGKHLEIFVSQGSLFFNIEQPLGPDETLNIRTSSMMVGIRGTQGWVAVENPEHMRVYLLEGTVECKIETAGTDEESVSVTAWQMADMQLIDGKGAITVHEFSGSDIPEFVQEELENSGQTPASGPDSEGPGDGLPPSSPAVDEEVTLTMPVTAQEIQELWSGGTKRITVLPGTGDNVLTIDSNFRDPSGNNSFVEDYGLLIFHDRTLILTEGVDLVVEEGITVETQGVLQVEGDVTIRGLMFTSGTTDIAGVIRILPVDGYTDLPNYRDNYGQLMAGGDFTARQEIINECYFFPTENVAADVSVTGEHGFFSIAGDYTGNITFDTGASRSSTLSDTIHGTVTVNRGTVYLAGKVDHIVVNGGEAYINGGEIPLQTDSLTVNGGTVHLMKVLPATSLGSVTVNGGELIDHSSEIEDENDDEDYDEDDSEEDDEI